MPLENSSTISQLDKTWPLSGDVIAQIAGQLRNLKKALKLQFPGSGGDGFSSVISATEDELNTLQGSTTSLQDQINSLSVASRVPPKAILIHVGTIANIPAGYSLCDGTNGTPNLVDQFILGATDDPDVGVTGGNDVAAVVTHKHTSTHGHTTTLASAGNHTHVVPGLSIVFGTGTVNQGKAAVFNDAQGTTHSIGSGGTHTHTITLNNTVVNTSSNGSSAAGTNLPAYYAVAFIMETS